MLQSVLHLPSRYTHLEALQPHTNTKHCPIFFNPYVLYCRHGHILLLHSHIEQQVLTVDTQHTHRRIHTQSSAVQPTHLASVEQAGSPSRQRPPGGDAEEESRESESTGEPQRAERNRLQSIYSHQVIQAKLK